MEYQHIITAVITAISGAAATWAAARLEVEKLQSRLHEVENRIDFIEKRILDSIEEIKTSFKI